jgi:hypothetical protein
MSQEEGVNENFDIACHFGGAIFCTEREGADNLGKTERVV